LKYPDQLVKLLPNLSLYIPKQEQVKIHFEALYAKDPTEAFPYWAKIWPSAIALTKYLQANPSWINNKKVLEMGAGIGLPSFSIAEKVNQLTITDHNADAVASMKKNITYLGLSNAIALELDWNHFPDHLQANTILLSDINYAPEQFDPLFNLIQLLINKGSSILIATPHRIMGNEFIHRLQELIKHEEILQIASREVEQPISIFVLYR